MVVLVDREYFQLYLAGVFQRVFSGRSIAEGCFKNESWEMALLPGGLLLPETDLFALGVASSAVGDSDCIVTDISLEPAHQKTALTSWARSEFAYIELAAQMTLESAMFGLSEKWGVYLGTAGSCSCVGGDPSFMSAFFKHEGGREIVKERFLTFAKNEWELWPEHQPAIIGKVWKGGLPGT